MPKSESEKRGGLPFGAVLAVGLLTNCCLRSTAAYPARVGLAAAVLAVPLLALWSGCFYGSWQQAENPVLRALFGMLLFACAVRELLRMVTLLQRVYPNEAGLLWYCVPVLLPVLYLRRRPAIAQTGRVLLWLLAGAGGVLLCSVLPRLRVEYLQWEPLGAAGVLAAAGAQLPLAPEYLLPALWPCGHGQQPRAAAFWRLPLAATGLDVGIHLMLELFFGAGATERAAPLYTAACSGALTVFTRLEWLQLFLWCGTVSLKLGLYLFATARLWRGHGAEEKTGVGLEYFAVYGVGLLFCVVLLRGREAELSAFCNVGCWGLAALTVMGGAALWLCQKAKR